MNSRNTYASVCYKCGYVVAAGEGHFERTHDSFNIKYGKVFRHRKWIVAHEKCPKKGAS